MNSELQTLLHRWREGLLTSEEMRTLNAILAKPEARAALRRDWFLDAALPQALAASAIIARMPQPTTAARLRAWLARWLPHFAPQATREEESTLGALQLWARTSLAALTVGFVITAWLAWPQRAEIATNSASEPDLIAQIMLESQLPEAP